MKSKRRISLIPPFYSKERTEMGTITINQMNYTKGNLFEILRPEDSDFLLTFK